MIQKLTVPILALAFLLSGLVAGCKTTTKSNDYLVSFRDVNTDEYGYKNQKGDPVIPCGKYLICFTDTFRTFAIVLQPHNGFVAIDRQEKVLYQVFPFDNGPDYPAEGLFRIIRNHKIGFADSSTGKVIIPPQFACAFPFENGVAEVSDKCNTQPEGEHSVWLSDKWYYINKTGKRVGKRRN